MRQLATYSRELAIMALTSRFKNFMCLYHSRNTSNQYTNDVVAEGDEIKVTGVPYGRIATSRVTSVGDHAQGGPVHAGVAFSCGCATEDVLLDFYVWKTTFVTSQSTDQEEGMKDDIFEPRHRAFAIEAIKSLGGIRLKNLYYKNPNGTIQNDATSLAKQIRQLIRENIDALHHDQFKKSIAQLEI